MIDKYTKEIIPAKIELYLMFYGLDDNTCEVWQAFPCMCKPCAIINPLAATTYFYWDIINDKGGIVCLIHKVM